MKAAGDGLRAAQPGVARAPGPGATAAGLSPAAAAAAAGSETPEAPRARVIAAFAAIYLIWGSTYLAIRVAIETLPPLLMLGARFAVAGLLMLAWARLRGAPAPTARHWRSAALMGLLIPCLGTGAVAWAEQTNPSGTVALLVATVPLWVALIDRLTGGGHRLGGRLWLGLAAGFAGVAVLAGPAAPGLGAVAVTPGALALVVGTLSWASGSVYSKRARLPGSAVLTTGMQLTLGGGMLLALGGLLGEGARVDLGAVSTASLVALAYLLICGTFVTFTAYMWLLRVTSPARVATYAYVNPVIALLLGWGLAGETLSPRVAVAAPLILTAVGLILSSPARAAAPARPLWRRRRSGGVPPPSLGSVRGKAN